MKLTKENENILRALKLVYDRIKHHYLTWVIIGSSSLWLQGVDIVPEDIDILADKEGAIKIGEMLQEFEKRQVSFSRSGRYESFFGQYEIHGVQLEVMGNLRILIRDEWASYSGRLDRRIFVEVEKMKLPVTSLRDHLESYQNLDREGDREKARKIREALEGISI